MCSRLQDKINEETDGLKVRLFFIVEPWVLSEEERRYVE